MRPFKEQNIEVSKAGLLRRLAAMFYDSLLCIALLMVTTGIYMAIAKGVLGAETYKEMNDSGATIGDHFLTVTLFASLFFFFSYFWTRNGQTLGMQVWHLRVQSLQGQRITAQQALIRLLVAFISAAACGLGYLWVLFDKQGRTWQCIASKTEVVQIPKRAMKKGP